MAKIMYGNYNDLPWMPNHRKDVDGKVMCYMKCFAMEAANMHMCIGKMYNGMPIGPHTHPNEQIATVVKGECDYWVDGVPYRLAPAAGSTCPPTMSTTPMCTAPRAPATRWTSCPPSAPPAATSTRPG